MQNNIKGCFFDLDGTLVDSLPGIHKAVVMSLEYLDKQPCSLKDTKSFIGNGVDFLIKKIMNLRSISEFETLRSLFLKNYKKVYLRNSPKYFGCREVLFKIRESFTPNLACITNKPYEYAKEILDNEGLEFEYIIGGDDPDIRKPSGFGITKACEFFNVDPKSCIYIGDSLVDFQASKTVGCNFIFASYGYGNIESKANVSIDSITELLNKLKTSFYD
jgi:phosphoglycolate phosphatase